MKPAASIVGVALSQANLDRLDALAKQRGISRSVAASAMLETALRATKPKPAGPPKRNNGAERALAELTAQGNTFAGRDFLRMPHCGARTLLS